LWSNNATSQNIASLSNGNYSITVTDGNSCTASTSVTITQPTQLTIGTTQTNVSCFNGNNGSITLTVNGGITSYSYLWNNGSTSQNRSALTNGSYSVTVTDGNSCTVTTSVTITQPTALNISGSITNVSTNGGHNGAVALTVSGGTTSYSYNWSNSATTQNINNLTAGVYNVTVTDANSCTMTASFTVTQPTGGGLSVTGTVTNVSCNGGTNGAINITVTGGSSTFAYLWSNGATTQNITALVAGSYTVTVTSGGMATASFTVNQPAALTFTTTSTNVSGCGVYGTIQVTASGGTGTKTYTDNGATYQANSLFSNLTAGTYTVNVKDANGCMSVASQVIIQTLFMNPPVITGPTSACTGNTITLALASTYSSYIWSNGATTSTTTVNATGTYTVTVTTGSCSASAHLSVTMLVNPAPVISIAANNYCEGTSPAFLSTSAYSTYLWNTGATTESITVPPNTPGTYGVTTSYTNGCTGSASYILSTACVVPSTLPTTNIASTSATANWTQPACVYSYIIRISKHNANVWTNYSFPPNSHYTFSSLTINTSYDWQIESVCNASQTDVSGFSSTQTFTTLARLWDGEIVANDNVFNVYPNPATTNVTILYSSESDQTNTLRLVDISGRAIMNTTVNAAKGDNQYQIDVSEFAKGVYMIMLQTGDSILRSKVVIQ